MTSINIAALLNLLGFATGVALYAMLFVMVIRSPAHMSAASDPARTSHFKWPTNRLLLATAILGLLWNLGALSTDGLRGFGINQSFPLILAVAYTALGFLPAVVVHSVLKSSGEQQTGESSGRRGIQLLQLSAYSLSTIAGILHFYDALAGTGAPSLWGLRALTVGYVCLIALLFLASRRQQGWQRAVGASALAVFAVSALHLSHHHDREASSWLIELTGHQASLPLVMAILYQDYRFALADIFLKRALALLVLVAAAFGLYLTLAAPLFSSGSEHQPGPRAIGVLLGLWVVTALSYPFLYRTVVRFVDNVILRRVDYGELRSRIAQIIASHESSSKILDELCGALRPALSASEVTWVTTHLADGKERREIPVLKDSVRRAIFEMPEHSGDLLEIVARLSESRLNGSVTILERSSSASAVAFIPTAEPPFHALVIGVLAGGRRLLSDDIAMLDSVVLMAARRIDSLRVTHERCEQSLREQEISKLATEAQLRALRAQVNPHFLFNALTTIGYLVQTAPDRALETLMKLTTLLRGVLRAADDFVTLGDELKLIASYLDIERARFEERLRVRVDVPEPLLGIRLPSFLVQPLVENAIKHGIAPARLGGEVSISARLELPPDDQKDKQDDVLCITVSDTGAGTSEIELARGRRRGVGLSNVEERLHCYCGDNAGLRITSTPGVGTIVYLRMPISNVIAPENKNSIVPPRSLRERRGA